MEVYEQEFLLARIIAGYSRYRLPRNVSVIVKPATIDQNYIAQEVFRETYELAEDRGIFTSRDILNIMIENDMWTPLDVKREEQIPKDIENIKVTFLKNQYGLILVNPKINSNLNTEGAIKYVNWLISDNGKELINNFKVNNEQLFFYNYK